MVERKSSAARLRLGVKRSIDFVVAGMLLLLLSPLYVSIAIAVRLMLGPPVFFTQVRPGRWDVPFTVRKFRTMIVERGSASGSPLDDAERTPRFGYILRQLSLDELPQLVSVLKGDMSLVGPRPLLMHYLDKYTPEQARRHEVRPGISGWAQVNGRQGLLFSERFKLDVWYVDNWSLKLDLKILLLTAMKVFQNEGVITGQDVADVDDVGFNRPDAKGSSDA